MREPLHDTNCLAWAIGSVTSINRLYALFLLRLIICDENSIRYPAFADVRSARSEIVRVCLVRLFGRWWRNLPPLASLSGRETSSAIVFVKIVSGRMIGRLLQNFIRNCTRSRPLGLRHGYLLLHFKKLLIFLRQMLELRLHGYIWLYVRLVAKNFLLGIDLLRTVHSSVLLKALDHFLFLIVKTLARTVGKSYLRSCVLRLDFIQIVDGVGDIVIRAPTFILAWVCVAFA